MEMLAGCHSQRVARGVGTIVTRCSNAAASLADLGALPELGREGDTHAVPSVVRTAAIESLRDAALAVVFCSRLTSRLERENARLRDQLLRAGVVVEAATGHEEN